MNTHQALAQLAARWFDLSCGYEGLSCAEDRRTVFQYQACRRTEQAMLPDDRRMLAAAADELMAVLVQSLEGQKSLADVGLFDETLEISCAAKHLLEKIQAGKLTDADGVEMNSFAPRHVAVKHWTWLQTADSVRNAADALVERGFLERKYIPPGEKGGRSSVRYLIKKPHQGIDELTQRLAQLNRIDENPFLSARRASGRKDSQ